MLRHKEEWKDIDGFEGYYQISNYGNVRALYREITDIYGKQRIYPDRVIKGRRKNNKGYIWVNLYKNSKIHSRAIHRLVWDAFGDAKRDGLTIDHINENKEDNTIWNLQLLTREDNFYKTRMTKREKYTSKYIGVSQNRIGKWTVRGIFPNLGYKHIGSFDNEEQAYLAYLQAKQYNP